MDAPNVKPRETWDRLVLLLIAPFRERWEHEFQERAQREIHRLALPEIDEAGHDE